MAGKGLFMHILALVGACPSGAPEFPFYVDSQQTISEDEGCAPFLSLESALITAAQVPTASISLLSNDIFPAWTALNTLSISGNSHILTLTGPISVPGRLNLASTRLVSRTQLDFAIEVTGTLSMVNCEISDFLPVPVLVKGRVFISESHFKGNTKGVLFTPFLGGTVSVTQSEFRDNAGDSGAVFYISPQGGLTTTKYEITNCLFEGNGAKAPGSVLTLSGLEITESTEPQIVSFSECIFRGNSRTTFQISNKKFNFIAEKCQFFNETQLIAGTLIGVSTIFTQISVSNSTGPLFFLYLSGHLSISNSSFVNIGTGPLITATGRAISFSFLSLSHVYLANISNHDPVTYGNLVSAQQVTINLTSVHIENFATSTRYGLFSLVGTVLYSFNLTAIRGTASVGVVGIITLSTIRLSETRFESLNSRGSMWTLVKTTGKIRGIQYRAILGSYNAVLKVYTTNFLTANQKSNISVERLVGELVNEGTPLIYVINATLTLTDSVLSGPIGAGVLTSQGGTAILRRVTFNITSARNLLVGLLGAYIDIDALTLSNCRLSSSLFGLSSDTEVRIETLTLRNVTSIALSKGQHFKLTIGEAIIDQGNIGSLVDFGIAV